MAKTDITGKKLSRSQRNSPESTVKPEILNDSKEMYRLIVENSRDVIFMLDTKGKFIYISPSIKKVLGYNPNDLIGEPLRAIVHRDDVKDVKEAIQRNIREGSNIPGGIEFRVRHKSGGWRNCNGIGNAVNDADGKFLNFMGVARDITESKQIQRALEASEENFRNSLDNSLIGIHIIDSNFQTLYLNRTFLDMFGYQNVEEVKAKPPHEYYTPETYAGYLRRRDGELRGEPVPDKLEIDIVRNDGKIRHLQLFRKQILWGGNFQYQILYNDVTDLKNAEKALQVMEQNLHNSLDTSLMGVYIIGADWNPLYVNQAFLDIFGYENISEVIAKPPQQFYTPESYADFTLRGERKLHGEILPQQVDVDIIRKDGTLRHLQLFGKSVTWNDVLHPQILYYDVTERKEIQTALQLSEQNFRNSMDSSSIGIRISDISDRTDYVNQALLDIFGYRDIDEAKNNIEVVTHFAPNLPEIIADRFQMQQVFLNIVLNAEQAMIESKGRGNLTVTTELSGDIIRVAFADNGPGIPADIINRIFDPFFTTKEVGKGIGLGLSICYGIVAKQGGRIFAQSQPGQGATFIIELPLTAPD